MRVMAMVQQRWISFIGAFPYVIERRFQPNAPQPYPRPIKTDSPPGGKTRRRQAASGKRIPPYWLAFEPLGAHPRMAGDVEHGAVRALELDLEEAFAVTLFLAHEAFGAERLQMLGGLFRVVDQDPEVVHPGVVHALADLVGLELEDGNVERAVAQEIALRQRTGRAGLADLLEAERLLVELRRRLRVVGGNRDMSQLGHGCRPVGLSCPPDYITSAKKMRRLDHGCSRGLTAAAGSTSSRKRISPARASPAPADRTAPR